MTNTMGTMERLTVGVCLALLMGACDGSSGSHSPTSSSPLAPTPTSPGPPATTYTLSGTVSEPNPIGLVPVEGVRVEVTSSGQRAVTDEDGFYSITGLSADRRVVSASKPGYETNTRSLLLSGDTRLDILVDRVVTYTLSGVVFEMTPSGRTPVGDVGLYCDSCGSPDGHTSTRSDSSGFYSFSWAHNGITLLLVGKDGYVAISATATVNGDTRLDIEVTRR
jgi:hypothetical protein